MEYVGFIMLGFLVVGLTVVFLRRKSGEKAMQAFYQAHSLFLKQNTAPKIREYLKTNENIYACQLNLQTANSSTIPVYWCEWLVQTQIPGRTTASIRHDYYLALFFAPKTIGNDFMQKAIALADKSEIGAMQKIKDQFTPDTERPLRAEMLADGTFLICWQMLKEREIYDAKIAWLKQNLSAG